MLGLGKAEATGGDVRVVEKLFLPSSPPLHTDCEMPATLVGS